MTITWALTIIGVFCIFAYEKWKFENEPHTFVGIVAGGLCFIQPFMAFLRPDPGASKRVIFNWVHRGVGVSAHILAGQNHDAISIHVALPIRETNSLVKRFYGTHLSLEN